MKNQPPVTMELRYPYEIKWLPLNSITTHPTVQRKFRVARARLLLSRWDVDKMGELEVVPNGTVGKYWCFEGQHRHWAVTRWLKEDGTQLVPCRVYGKLPEKVLADFRLARDSQMRMVPVDRFLMAVIAGDAIATAVKIVLENFGLHVRPQLGDGVVQSVVACERVAGRPNGVQVLQATIKILNTAFGKAREAYNGMLVTAVANMIRRYGDGMDHKRLVAAMQTGPKGAVSIVAAGRTVARELGMNTVNSVAEILVKAYNKQRLGPGGKKSKLPRWSD
jgi:hypothetical protein